MEWLFWKIIGFDPLGGWSYLVLGLAAILLVRYLTGSWKATWAIALGAVTLFTLARARRSGEKDFERKVEKENVAVLKESRAIEKESQKRTPAQRRKRVSKFVRDD